MTVTIRPSRAGGTVSAPPSKSGSQRALLCAALCRDGHSRIRGLAFSDDILAAIDCLRALGAHIEQQGNHMEITGVSPERFPAGAVLPCRSSGTTLRFLIPLSLISDKDINFTGSRQLFSRPLSVYEEICRQRGLRFFLSGQRLTVRGPLAPGAFQVPGDVSSQFISGLAFALPLLTGNSVVRVLPPLGSKPYLDMTLDMLDRFGVAARWEDGCLSLAGGQQYRPTDLTVEGDWSNAAFFLALNALGGDVTVTGLSADSLQGDRAAPACIDALRRGTPTLDLSDCPDLGPVCMALAAALHGAVFTGVRRLRYKESDRIASMTEELAKCGVAAQADDDSVFIPGGALTAPCAPFSGHGDHRIVMALAVLATLTGGVIRGAEAVSKSCPDFFDALRKLGVSCLESAERP